MTAIDTTRVRYRATCSCGYRGRWFINPNDAVAAEETHLISTDDNAGRHYDRSGRRHQTTIAEVTR